MHHLCKTGETGQAQSNRSRKTKSAKGDSVQASTSSSSVVNVQVLTIGLQQARSLILLSVVAVVGSTTLGLVQPTESSVNFAV